MAIFLGGGGSREESVELDRVFAASVGAKRLVYWPFAMADHPDFDTCEAWLRRTLEPFGVSDIETWTSLTNHDLAVLGDAGGLYIGGGNTYRLLDEVQRADATSVIAAAVGRGLHVYGGSAGAALLGSTIETIAHLDRNEVGITDLDGVDVLRGAAVWVHYEPHERERVEQLSEERGGQLVIALQVDGGAVVDGETITARGFSPARLISSADHVEIAPDDSLPWPAWL